MNFTWIDYTIFIVCISSAIFGVMRGFIKSFFSLLGLIAATYFAIKYAQDFKVYLPKWIGGFATHEMPAKAISFLVIFFTIVIVSCLCGNLLTWLMQAIDFKPVDRILGFVFGSIRGFGLVLTCIFLLQLIEFDLNHLRDWQQSIVKPFVEKSLTYIMQMIRHSPGGN